MPMRTIRPQSLRLSLTPIADRQRILSFPPVTSPPFQGEWQGRAICLIDPFAYVSVNAREDRSQGVTNGSR